MKLTGFLRCYRKAIEKPSPENSPRTEEFPALKKLSCAATGSESPESCKSKTGRRTDRNPVAGSGWRSSLDAISEDKAVPMVVVKRERVVRSRKNLAGKAVSTAKSHVPVKRKEFRQVVIPTPIPTFTPMAFLF
eukprot:TRINITY_DN5777_c0_g1_i1.p1 TRINITY_DN5777_c0_g1~~TRINITY_DN5777_c0_g1_i1.p1  ORF type:complete len:134 (+),score=5.07 TRINITY_DN5777_c0_g1_i1:123-524(+)